LLTLDDKIMDFKEFNLKSKFDKVQGISKNIGNYCSENNVPQKAVNDIEICLIEAINNVIEHSYNSESTHDIKIIVEIGKAAVCLKIIDYGAPRKIFKEPKLEYDSSDIENLPVRGMGLFIMSKLMSETHYETVNDENIFTLLKRYSN
jgi:serine/threonine-protein kinase RsbW